MSDPDPCDCGGEMYPPPMGGMLDQPCVSCSPRAWDRWNKDPYGHMKRDAVVRKNNARAALDALTGPERVAVFKHYMGSMKKALADLSS